MNEEWRQIEYAPGYEISNIGRVASWRPEKNYGKIPAERRLLKLRKDKDGYNRTTIYINNKPKSFRVSVLVTEAWHGARPNGMVACHIDGSKSNDTPDNLRWGTLKDNSADMIRHGTRRNGSIINTSKLKADDVLMIRESSLGHTQLARMLNVTPCAIWHIRDGRTWKHLIKGQSL